MSAASEYVRYSRRPPHRPVLSATPPSRATPAAKTLRQYVRYSRRCDRPPQVLALLFLGPRPRRLPRRLPRHPHYGRILKVFSMLKGEYDVIQRVKRVNSVQMAYNSKTLPRLGRPWNDSGSDSSRYVRHTDTTCATLMLVVQSARRQPAL